ncbi:MAG: sulfatase-like hydrolase/transferase [Candidatus Latescibacterota bacterium]
MASSIEKNGEVNVQDRPNILWISTHDTSAWNYGCYGDTYSRTPNLDRLAAEGVRYTKAFTAGPICSPSRTSIYTGMHPTTLGTHHHRSYVIRPKGVELLPKMLMDAGYACTQPDGDLNLYVSEEEYEQYDNSANIWEKPDDKPFFACFRLGDSHGSVFKLTPDEARKQRSALLCDDELHDPKDAPVPSFVPDTPLYRERMALFYDALTNVDKQAGEILDRLEEQGLSDNTIVVFWGDHGTGYPRGKIHAYDDGLRIPLIMRFPEKYQHLAPGRPGSTVDDPVMHMDLAATTLRLAGIPIPDHFQSRVLCGPDKDKPREFVCSARDRLDNNPEMIRTIRTRKYRYIRNFLPHQPYASFYPDGGFFATIPEEGTAERAFWETSCLPGKQRVHDPDGVFLMLGPPVMINQNGLPEQYRQFQVWQDHKPLEELYDLDSDPEEVSNLADDPAFYDVRDELRQKLFAWMIETRDLGLLDETEIVARAAQCHGISREVGLHCGNFERILETADLPRLGDEGRTELLNRLDDPDSAVRFWAVTGLCSLGVESAMIERLAPLLGDPSISVSLAAGDYLVRAGEGALALPAFTQALTSEILWARIRAGAYLSYRSREELQPMKSLIPTLEQASKRQEMFGPEHDPHIETNQFAGMLNAQRDVIGKQWVLDRVLKRIELSADQEA